MLLQKGADWEADAINAPRVRQFPLVPPLLSRLARHQTLASAEPSLCCQKGSTRIFDDKREQTQLMRALFAKDRPAWLPATLEHAPEGGKAASESEVKGSLLGWFVKHRLGCKGKAVRYAPSSEAAVREAERMGGRGECVIQREVSPALDELGHKVTARAHILLARRGDSPLQAWRHQCLLEVHHSAPYSAASTASHVSQAGKGQRFVTRSLEEFSSQQAQDMDEIVTAIATVGEGRLPVAQPGECLYVVIGVDLLLRRGADRAASMIDRGRDEDGLALLECNDRPAIASGSMGRADTSVYTDLVCGMVKLLTFNKEDAQEGVSGVAQSERGGWVLSVPCKPG